MKHQQGIYAFFIAIAVFFSGGNADPRAQTSMSLNDCLNYGLSHNAGVQKSSLETEKSEVKVKEVYSALYPQVRGSASINDNLKLQTSILPGEIFGQPGVMVPVQFGTQYNVTTAIDATQILFDPGVLSGVRLANKSIEIASLNEQVTQEQLLFSIAQAYYSIQITMAQQGILEENLKNMDSLVNIARAKYETQFILRTDYDRVLFNRSNLENEIRTLGVNYEKQLRLLKYYTGIPMDSVISVESATAEVTITEVPQYDSTKTLDVQMLGLQQEMYDLNIKQVQSGYVPSLSLSYRYAYMAQQNDLKIFGSNSQWYPMSYLTLNLSVPIFDGFAKSRKVQQLEIEIDKTRLDLENTIAYQNMQYENALGNLAMSLSSLEISKQNMELTQKIYQNTKLQLEAEMSGMTEMLNAETTLNQAQSNYLGALIQLKISQLELLKSTGNIKTILE